MERVDQIALIYPRCFKGRVVSDIPYTFGILWPWRPSLGRLFVSSEEMQGLSAMLGSKEAVNSKSSSFNLPKISKEVETDQQSQLQEGNELMQQARLKLGIFRTAMELCLFFFCV